MNDEGNAARKIRKPRVSRDLWKQRSAEKQQEIRQLRVTVRDLSSSRENWKTRVKELEQQLQAAHEAHAAVGPGSWIFFGGLMDNQAMPRGDESGTGGRKRDGSAIGNMGKRKSRLT
jgi:uncharacterized protein YhaN